VTVKTFILQTESIIFQINAVLLNFLFLKAYSLKKCITVLTKAQLFSTLFQKDHATLNVQVMKILLCHQEQITF